jgi:predicted transcriptional regulator
MFSCERLWHASFANRSQTMNVGTICKRNVVTAREGDELNAAAQLMRGNHVGYLVIVEPNPANDMMCSIRLRASCSTSPGPFAMSN